MIQKISAYAALAMIGLIFLIGSSIEGELSFKLSDFDTIYGKAAFILCMCVVAAPFLINFISMFFHMIMNGKFKWMFGSFIFVFIVTLFYYFEVYSKPKTN